MKEKILVIDDDPDFLMSARTWFHNAGFETIAARDGLAGLRRVYSSRPSLVLLDVHTSRMDGWEVCRRVRDMTDIPVIMMTGDSRRTDLLQGFALGADDFITKPVDFWELVARMRAVLRRSAVAASREEDGGFCSGDIEIDWRSHQVWVRGEAVKLSPTEFRVLSCLIRNRGWTITHDQILQSAWGNNHFADRSFVKLYVRYLRRKLEKDPENPQIILTERGVGYRFPVEEGREAIALVVQGAGGVPSSNQPAVGRVTSL
jgi:two-component system KDP operon response regulator KdpE